MTRKLKRRTLLAMGAAITGELLRKQHYNIQQAPLILSQPATPSHARAGIRQYRKTVCQFWGLGRRGADLFIPGRGRKGGHNIDQLWSWEFATSDTAASHGPSEDYNLVVAASPLADSISSEQDSLARPGCKAPA